MVCNRQTDQAMNKQYVALLLAAKLVCSYGCRRDVVEPGPSISMDGRQKFVGTYDVYDTLGNWKYEMQISLHEGEPIDSIFIEGWGVILIFMFNIIKMINPIF